VRLEQASAATILVDSDAKVKSIGCSWKASEGKAPESPVFDAEGGVKSFVVTSAKPNDVLISNTAKIVFDEPKFPVIQIKDEDKIGEGGNMMVIKPSQYVGRHMIYLYVLDKNGKVKYTPDPGEHVVVNIAYTYKDSLTDPRKPKTSTIRGSARLEASEGPMEFSYPYDPNTSTPGQAVFSAVGVVGRKLVRAKAQPINFTEEAVFILASPTEIKLVTESSIPEESSRDDADAFVRRLLATGSRPAITSRDEEVSRSGRTERDRRRANREGARRGETQLRRSEVLRFGSRAELERENEALRRLAEQRRREEGMREDGTEQEYRRSDEAEGSPHPSDDRTGSTLGNGRTLEGAIDAVEMRRGARYLWLGDADGRREFRVSDRFTDRELAQLSEDGGTVTVQLDPSGTVVERIQVLVSLPH
jgi:hypothetical protein